jgi:ATP-dependent helicase/nuclease subunit A
MAVSEVRALHRLKGNQRRASDPARHVWLSASAGTGKTQVLAARVWRLLLAGVDPGAILCLTFTKAVRRGDVRADHQPAGALGARAMPSWSPISRRWARASPEGRARARTLFAKVLDAPGGGIRIQTIHSFCQSCSRRFRSRRGWCPASARSTSARKRCWRARRWPRCWSMPIARGAYAADRAVGALSLRLGEGKAEGFLLACASNGEAMAMLPSGIQPFLRRAMGLPRWRYREIEACGDDAFD